MSDADRSATLQLLASHMAAGQLAQARTHLADPWKLEPRGPLGPVPRLVVALEHMRAAVGWMRVIAR